MKSLLKLDNLQSIFVQKVRTPGRWIWISLAVSILLHLIGMLLSHQTQFWRWAHEPSHSFVEASGAVIGITVAGILVLMNRLGSGTSFNIRLAFGLFTMALLDGLHAVVHVGESFVWLHSTATFAGGCLFSLVCIPAHHHGRILLTAMAICFTSLVLGTATFIPWFPLPRMVESGQFTEAAVLLNIGGGALMLLAAIRLGIAFYRTGNRDDLLFAIHCMLFGGAAVMFEQSQLWDFSWWWWHGLRLAAYFVAIAFGVESLVRLQLEVLSNREMLKDACIDAEGRADAAHRYIRTLREAIDDHTLFSVTDISGKIIEVNNGFCRLSGFTREELIGSDHRIVNSGHHPREFWARVWKSLLSGQTFRADVCNRAKDGSLYWVDSTYLPQLDSDGKIFSFISLRINITERKNAEEALARQTRRAEELASEAASAIRVLDAQLTAIDRSQFRTEFAPDGTIIAINKGMLDLIGYCENELIGTHHRLLVMPEQRDSEQYRQFWRVLRSGTYHQGEFLRIAKDGTHRWIQASYNPVFDENGIVEKIVKYAIDITEKKRADAELAEQTRQAELMAEQARLANNAKSEFLANMSHEIRTPMTAILGFADVLLDEGDISQAPERRVNAIRTIQKNGEHLLGVINDILDISKIEAGKLIIKRRTCAPCKVIAEVVSLMQLRASDQNIEFRIDPDGPLPEAIECDDLRLRQILINLVGNAIKFTEQGSVRLVPRVVTGAVAKFQIDIVDTGIGMSAAHASNLFQPFTQADSSMARKFGGTGLGLAISRRLSQMMGGGIEIAATALGMGTTMRLTVDPGSLVGVAMIDDVSRAISDFVDANEILQDGAEADDTAYPLAGLRILLAEDGPDNQRLLSFMLEKAGATVDIVDNGEAAINSVWQNIDSPNPYDIVLMDMQMPIMDGYKATSQLRATGFHRPIVAITAHAMRGEMEKCLAAGCDGYLTKPIKQIDLVKGVLKNLRTAPRRELQALKAN